MTKPIYGVYPREDLDFEFAGLQLEFLKEHGMKEHHYLLDVGCGPLREGIVCIDYLDKGHYYGIDAHEPSLEFAWKRLEKFKPKHKEPVLILMGNFDFKLLNQIFDYAYALSLFTHIDDDDIKLCLNNIGSVLKPEAKFYATFFLGDKEYMDRDRGFTDSSLGHGIRTYRNGDPFHQPLSFYIEICPSNLKMEYVGICPCKRQDMLCFTKLED